MASSLLIFKNTSSPFHHLSLLLNKLYFHHNLRNEVTHSTLNHISTNQRTIALWRVERESPPPPHITHISPPPAPKSQVPNPKFHSQFPIPIPNSQFPIPNEDAELLNKTIDTTVVIPYLPRKVRPKSKITSTYILHPFPLLPSTTPPPSLPSTFYPSYLIPFAPPSTSLRP